MSLRVWIITALIVFSAMGAYFIWATRPRITYTSRSLSAPANSGQTRNLHVAGCNDDFIVKIGELVEPRATSGTLPGALRKIYGPETFHDKSGTLTWDQRPYTLTAAQNPASIQISLNQGHVLQTLDGIELGIDSFGTVLRKMRDRGVETHERIAHTGNNWTLIVTFYSACSHNYRSEYTRTLPTTPELEKQIPPPPPTPGQPASLYRSAVFMNKVVSEYQLIPSNKSDESTQGQPATHN